MRKTMIVLGLAVLAACGKYNGDFTPQPPEGSVVISDRLSNQSVNCFTQDKDGHIWIGTFRGLNRFAVAEYQQFYCTDDTLGLPDNQINALHTSRDGTLWIATINGVATGSNLGIFRRIPIQGSGRNIRQILESRDGKLFFSDFFTLYQYDESQQSLRPVIREFNAFGAPACIMASDGNIWAISDGGFTLKCFSPSSLALLFSTPLPAQTYHISEGLPGEIWLSGMGRMSIFSLQERSWKELPAPIREEKRLMTGDVDKIFPIDENSLLLNVIGKGFFYYQRNKGNLLFQTDAGFPFRIPETEVSALYLDNRHNLWIGTSDQGFQLSHHDAGLFGSNPSLTSAFAGKTVLSLCVDKSDGLWISTLRDGLFRYDLGTQQLQEVDIQSLIPDASVGYIRVNRLFCDAEGDLWLQFTEKTRTLHCQWDGRRLTVKDLIYSYNPMAIAQDDTGCIWIGGMETQLHRFDKRTRTDNVVSLPGNSIWNYVTEMVPYEPGKLLVGRFNETPLMVNTYSQECQEHSISPEDRAACIRRSILIPNKLFRDSEGDIWLGTIGNGLLHDVRGGGVYPIQGAPCLDICSIEEDRQGNLWVSTMAGLGRYDRTTNSFVTYMEADGIGGDQFSERASVILPNGTLVFGGTHGITWFNPLDAPARRTIPLLFENLTIHGQLVAPSEDGPIDRILSEKPEVLIRDHQNAFDISFAALDYGEPEQIRYAYKLEGFDKDWVRIFTRHDAYFANVPPGRYTLRVRIANGSHSVTQSEESLPIRVLPPVHRSWWAYLVYVLSGLFLLAVAWTVWRHIRRVRREAARRIREVRREREQAQEAEKAEKALNKIQMNYFANVAHEFRTPLTMIAGPASQLASSETIQGQERKLVNIIRRNAIWMLSLVNQLLDFNRIGNQKLGMKVAKMDIVAPLREIAELFTYNAKSKNIELSTYGLGDSFVMWVDGDKVQKVVMNLLSNALKFTPSGGKVSLSFDVISREDAAARFPLTEADTDGQYACISVSDTGCGIPPEELESIFDRFYQTVSGKKDYGSGIGLYYARALCELHHGYIKAWNREEGGALFSVILPVSASSYSEDERSDVAPELQLHALLGSQPAAETAQETDESARKHIVVVDDDIDIANYLKVLLKPNYKVSVYFDAASALKGMEEESPDLVISDVVMPGMSGYELCECIKNSLQLSHIPVVLVTAKVAVENQVQGLDKGADAYVTKPFQPAYLLALVKSMLENREKLHRQLGEATTTEEIAPESLSPRDAAFMKELYELMEKELANTDLDILRITEMMKISRTKFYYKVKGLTGVNPSVFFKRYKLNRAAELLKEGKYNMSEIAYMTGFNTLSHFSTSFKKQFGVPPSEYIG